jgi:hypothetical protein
MGGSRGVGNPVCPPEGREAQAKPVGKCWVIHAFKAGGAKAPGTPKVSSWAAQPPICDDTSYHSW